MSTQGLDPRILEATEKGDPRTELAAVRTGLAFERARQAADRTLMAILRTSLALIAFGFGAFQAAVLFVLDASVQVDPVAVLLLLLGCAAAVDMLLRPAGGA
jgi:uncharacterized membrane protein YidH (DUF202 family)